jgi:hypothetical protein
MRFAWVGTPCGDSAHRKPLPFVWSDRLRAAPRAPDSAMLLDPGAIVRLLEPEH